MAPGTPTTLGTMALVMMIMILAPLAGPLTTAGAATWDHTDPPPAVSRSAVSRSTIHVSSTDSFPYLMDQSGNTYLVTEDLTATGTAFVFKGNNLTLDLGGHNVTYNSGAGDRRYGAAIPSSSINHAAFPDLPDNYFGGAVDVVMGNGTLWQGAGGGQYSHGIELRGDNVEVHDLHIHVHGTDSCNLRTRYAGGIDIHDNNLTSEVDNVTNRHYPGADGIVAWAPRGDHDIHNNTLYGQPQWGIRLSGSVDSNYDLEDYARYHYRVHDNFLRTDVVTTNGYALGVHTPYMEVYGNTLGTRQDPSRSRGIHITSHFNDVHDNDVYVQENPNPEYPETRTHGIKLEGCRGALVHNNTVVSMGDLYQPVNGWKSDGDALDISVPVDSDNEVFNNTFTAIRKDADVWATAIDLVNQEAGSGTLVHDNVFETNHWMLRVDWGGANDMEFRNNTLRYIDPADGHNSEKWSLYFWMGTTYTSRDLLFIDNVLENGVDLSDPHFRTDAYDDADIEYTVAETVGVTLRWENSTPIRGATVTLTDATDTVSQGTTDLKGTFWSQETVFVRDFGDQTDHTPHDLSITHGSEEVVTDTLHLQGNGSEEFLYHIPVPQEPPGQPLNTSATAGDGFVRLDWDRPGDRPNTPEITDYSVYRGEEGGPRSHLITVNATDPGTTYNDTGVENGVTYFYNVTALNRIGPSPSSEVVKATPMARPTPPVMGNVTAGEGHVVLEWSPPVDDGGSPVTAYRLYRGNASGDLHHILNLSAGSSSHNDTGVENGKRYYYHMTAVNLVGEGPPGQEVSATPELRLRLPGPPTNLTAGAGEGHVGLEWTPPLFDGYTPLTGYRVYRATAPGDDVLLNRTGPNITFLNDTTVENGVTYTYHVTAVNIVGEGPFSEGVEARPEIVPRSPGPPRNLTAEAGDRHVNLSWEPPDHEGTAPIQGYRVYRGTEAGNLTCHVAVRSDVTRFQDPMVKNNVTYRYAVSATNEVGESDLTDVVEVRPEAPGPTGPPDGGDGNDTGPDDGGGGGDGGDGDGDDGGPWSVLTSSWAIAAVVVAVVVVAVVITMLLVRRKGDGGSGDPGPPDAMGGGGADAGTDNLTAAGGETAHRPQEGTDGDT